MTQQLAHTTSEGLLSDGVMTVTPFGAEIHRPLTIDEWKQRVRMLQTVHRSYLSALADLTKHGIEQFGPEVVSQEFEQLEFDLQDATKADVISRLPLDVRQQYRIGSNIAFIIVTLIEDPKEREKWAAVAARENLSELELKASIKAGRILRKDEIDNRAGHSSSIPTVQGARFTFDRWLRSAGGEEKVLALPKKERAAVLKTLEPIIALAAHIEESLSK